MVVKEHAKSSTGVVHEVIQVSKPGLHTYFTIACDTKNFNLGVDGWWNGWKKTNAAVTCKHCLQGREGHRIRYKLYACKYKTAKGFKTSYMVAQNKTDAGLGLVIQGRIKHTSIHIEITEVKMDKRRFLG
jgi:hypothetical protein